MPTTPFGSAIERGEADTLGMWAFLATEVLFFAPLFFGYVHGRIATPEAFVSGSHRMHVALGTLNTAILMTSSLTMAIAVGASQEGRPAFLRKMLVATIALGIAFLCVKGFEYRSEWPEAVRA